MEAKGSSVGRPPVKGILKNPSSSAGSGLGLAGMAAPSAAFLQQQAQASSAAAAAAASAAASASSARARADSRPILEGKKSQKWDEMNILATYHPAGKDYGLMKIDEPSTPYHAMVGDDEDACSDTESSAIPTADILAQKLAAVVEGKGPKVLAQEEDSSDEDEDETELSPEEREKKKQFEMKRKMHYNEGQNIKLARQLIAKELHGAAVNDDEEEDEEDEDEEMRDATDLGGMSPELDAADHKRNVSFCFSYR
ncbi:protein phosphatase inhibitor 2 isoform X2 [Sceloporus undulatus]|uniref:protein phosphatase inhibitor 2 isoform X2 n=1 Tax=Sceloporus undulatus TaxID=8520 RepID=UPI001C4CA694|nr:protein phosphatase inhibitor 2 isoform X2 [Sceloporus undulatus]